MNLQIETVNINNVVTGPKTVVHDHVLQADLKGLEEIILADHRIKSVNLDWVYPGERIRIVNVVDVIQPRCKIEPEGEDFPGWLCRVKTVGYGRTRSLQGVSVIVSNHISKRPYSAILDMFGKGSEWSKYARLINLSIDPSPSEGTEERDFEAAVKIAGLKTAVYLARAAEKNPVDQIDTYELDIPKLRKTNLPKIAYAFLVYTNQHDFQGISDPILYGGEVGTILPLILHPNEVLDGALVNAQTIRGMDTYSIQNHAIIKELYKQHGKTLSFAGTVAFVASMEPVNRERIAILMANLVSNVLGVDGVLLSKVHGGMPHVDLALAAEICEQRKIKTVLFVQFFESGTSLSEGTLFNAEELNAVVNVGQTLERIHLPSAEQILGGSAETKIFNPEFIQKAGDAMIDIEGHLLAGFHDHLGGSNIMAVDY
jgi:sarcosine reductase